MDPLTMAMAGLLAVLVLGVVALGLFAPGSGAGQLDRRPARSPAVQAQNELEDVDQMVEAINVRRRARGERELTEAEVEAQVLEELREHGRRRA